MRRKRRASGEGSYDSVLDTMTNVVGILIIVVAVTQVGVADAVRTSYEGSARPTVKPADVAAAQTEADRLRRLLDELEARLGKLVDKEPESRAELDRLKPLIAELKQELDDPIQIRGRRKQLEEDLAKLEKLLQQLQRRSAEAVRLAKETKSRAEEEAKKNLTPRRIGVPLPDPNRAKGKSARRFVCKNGNLYPLEEAEVVRAFVRDMADFMKRQKITAWDRAQLRSFIDSVNEKKLSNSCWRAKFGYSISGRSIDWQYRFDLRSDAPGETKDQIAAAQSRFRRAVGSIKPDQTWVAFLVYDGVDNFELYLSARRMAERLGFAVGWIPVIKDQPLSFGGGGRGSPPD